MWHGFDFLKLTLHVINQGMLKSNDNLEALIKKDLQIPSQVSFFRLDKDYDPREYDKSNKTLPSAQTSPLMSVKISCGMKI